MLTRDEILQRPDMAPVKADVPEWGGVVYVRPLTGAERDSYEASQYTMQGDKLERHLENLRARLLVRAICDESGKRLFTDADAPALGEKSAAVLGRLFVVAQRLSGMTAEAAEDAEKN